MKIKVKNDYEVSMSVLCDITVKRTLIADVS